MMRLSILIPTLPQRKRFLDPLYDELERQRKVFEKEVEILVLLDQGQRSIGSKRNRLKELAIGEYIVFIDDDDWVSENYIEYILSAIKEYNTDVITFLANVVINGGSALPCVYSSRFKDDKNHSTHYERLPNHICPVRSSCSPHFHDLSFGEDTIYARDLKNNIASEVHIPYFLYYYKFSSETSESRRN